MPGKDVPTLPHARPAIRRGRKISVPPESRVSNQPEFDVPRPDLGHLVTEDDTPVDNPFQDLQQDLLRAGLSEWRAPSAAGKHVALTNVGLFGGIRQTAIVPDFLLSLDVELPPDRGIKEDRAYYIWEYGKAPDLVVEVVSNTEGEEETTKLRDYARLGIPYYLIYDRHGFLSHENIRLFELGPARRYRRRKSLWVPMLNLGFTTWEGVFGGLVGCYLRLCDEHGILLPTGDERAQRETARADQERARADRLREKLLTLGIDPDGP